MKSRLQRTGVVIAQGLVVLIGWLCIMVAYSSIYDAFEKNAIPVSVTPFKDFYWDGGYVFLAGSFASDTPESDEELPLQTSKITCLKKTGTCDVATAKIVSDQVSVDDHTFDIKEWTDQFIAVDDDSPICSTQHYIINRAAESLQIVSKKKSAVTEAACKISLDEQHISLKKGWDVYWGKVQDYERKNSIYFHLLIVSMNVAYGLTVVYLFRRRRS